MNDTNEQPSSAEILEGLRAGCTFDPGTPGLQEAARELMRPIVEKMDGQEIIYDCRELCLMRVVYLEVDDDGFRAVAKPLQYIYGKHPPPEYFETPEFLKMRAKRPGMRYSPWDPLDVRAGWSGLRMSGSSICMNYITDQFYPDPAMVAEVMAAAARKAPLDEIHAILDRGKKCKE